MKRRNSRAGQIQQILKTAYPHVKTQLNHGNPFELLVAAMLSAQCTDRQVNRVTPALFDALPTPEAFAEASLEYIDDLIHIEPALQVLLFAFDFLDQCWNEKGKSEQCDRKKDLE